MSKTKPSGNRMPKPYDRRSDVIKTAAIKILESDIQKAIIDYLEMRRAYVVRVQVGAAMYSRAGEWVARRSSMTGFPDLIVCFNGRVTFVEVKRPGGRLSEAQIAVHDKLRDVGMTVLVATSLDDVKDRLDIF